VNYALVNPVAGAYLVPATKGGKLGYTSVSSGSTLFYHFRATCITSQMCAHIASTSNDLVMISDKAQGNYEI